MTAAFWFILGMMCGCVPALFIIQACRLAARADTQSKEHDDVLQRARRVM